VLGGDELLQPGREGVGRVSRSSCGESMGVDLCELLGGDFCGYGAMLCLPPPLRLAQPVSAAMAVRRRGSPRRRG